MPRFTPQLKSYGLGILALCLAGLCLGLLRRHGACGLDELAIVGFALAIVIEPKA